MMERLSIFLIQFINLHSCLNDLLILNCLIIHYKIHKLIKIRKYFDDIWIECLNLHCGLFFFCLNLHWEFFCCNNLPWGLYFCFFFPHHNFLKHFLIQILLCILLFFVRIFTRQSFFSNLLVFSLQSIFSNLLVFSLQSFFSNLLVFSHIIF